MIPMKPKLIFGGGKNIITDLSVVKKQKCSDGYWRI